nr:M56 family metallopeptidase [uncultured Carboxylicivirga sp.]
MSALTYYIYANVYILIFWFFFHYVLRKETFFQGQRMYILSSVIISSLLPLSALYSNFNDVVYTLNPINLVVTNDFNIVHSVITPVSVSKFSWSELIKYITVLGGLLALLVHVYNHIRIYSLINKSSITTYEKFNVIISSENITPFLYLRNIVLPKTLSNQEKEIAIQHEIQHYKLAHGIDNILFQLFQTIFWINPVIYLLKRDLKQIHEFQVDQKMLISNIDVSIYQLTLIKFSVGCQKFAVANGLANSRIKNRIKMMNRNITVSWKWKFLLFIPAFIVVLSLVSFSQSTMKNGSLTMVQSDSSDSIVIENIFVPESFFNDIKVNDAVIVTMNKNSQLLIDNQEISLAEVRQTVYNYFVNKTLNKLDLTAPNLLKTGYQETKIYVKQDSRTKEDDYKMLVESLSSCILQLQDLYSNKAFGKAYSSLSVDEKSQIRNLIQPRLYTMELHPIEKFK